MNKIKMLSVIIVVTFSLGFIFSSNKISNAKDIDILTKNAIFDIIDDVEDTIITCISMDGQRNLSNENKLDATLMYIIKNKEKYDILENNLMDFDLSQENISIGKISTKDFEKQLRTIFANFKYKISDYKYTQDNNVDLVYEPCEYFTYETKELLYARYIKNVYEVVYKYKRSLNGVVNDINVKYIFTNRMKIKDVIILSSNMR